MGRNLEVELQAARSEVLAQIKAFKQEEFARTILEASDVFMAAATLSKKKFLIGAGDRTAFLNLVLGSDPNQIPDLFRKLQLVCSDKFLGAQVVNDKSCTPQLLSKKMTYKLWLHTCRKSQSLTL